LSGQEKAATLAVELVAIAEQEVERRIRESGQTREEILADATATWGEAVTGADKLLELGHGPEPAR
jgi:phosphoribosylcarboxyaminoimidazole (NCAIR) mutase